MNEDWLKASACGPNGCVEQRNTPWLKARASGTGGCVEQRQTPGDVEVRDSKNPDGPVLTFAPAAYAAWINGAKRGEFDHLV